MKKMNLNNSIEIFYKVAFTNLDYSELRKEVEQRGLLSQTQLYYAANFTVNLFLLASFYWFVLYLNSWYAILLLAVPIAAVHMQFAYMGHDAGHNAVSKKIYINDCIGYFCHSFLLGGSFAYWKYKHNEHHSNPNHEELDPDLKRDPFAFSENKARRKKGLSKVLTRYQAFIVPFTLSIVLLLMRIDSLKYMWKHRKDTVVDLVLMILHSIAFIAAPILVLGMAKTLILYFIVCMLIGFYFGFAFMPNHVGMRIFTDDDKLSYLEQQVLSSRNLKSGIFWDIVLGGLNYQIEHHLFPQISRKNLPGIKVIVKGYCAKKSISYMDNSVAKAWKDIFVYLNEIGKQSKRFSVVKLTSEMI